MQFFFYPFFDNSANDSDFFLLDFLKPILDNISANFSLFSNPKIRDKQTCVLDPENLCLPAYFFAFVSHDFASLASVLKLFLAKLW